MKSEFVRVCEQHVATPRLVMEHHISETVLSGPAEWECVPELYRYRRDILKYLMGFEIQFNGGDDLQKLVVLVKFPTNSERYPKHVKLVTKCIEIFTWEFVEYIRKVYSSQYATEALVEELRKEVDHYLTIIPHRTNLTLHENVARMVGCSPEDVKNCNKGLIPEYEHSAREATFFSTSVIAGTRYDLYRDVQNDVPVFVARYGSGDYCFFCMDVKEPYLEGTISSKIHEAWKIYEEAHNG